MYFTTIATMLFSAGLALPIVQEPDVVISDVGIVDVYLNTRDEAAVVLTDVGIVDAPINARDEAMEAAQAGLVVLHDVDIADE
ncbi:hypothetical protein F5Y09DRAFT_343504 [Xylaria sp. FL1042]|nr:hypothetical protein F5Y09DRAFT_343504 [Xylaria sp. FL1042]